MKVEKEMNWSPSKDWNVYVILGRGRRTYLYTGLSKSRADQVVKAFNSALSSHVSKETAPLLAEIDRLKNEVERLTNIGHTPESEMNELSTRELIERLIASQLKVEKLEFMIENGLGYEDMANDITMPHEV